MRRFFVVAAAILPFIPSALASQQIAHLRTAVARPDSVIEEDRPAGPRPIPLRTVIQPRDNRGLMLLSGIALGAAGAYAAGNAAYREQERRCSDACNFTPVFAAGAAAEAIAFPLGVHLAGGLKGNLFHEIMLSSAIMFAGVALAPATGGVSALAVLPAQAAVVITLEHRAGQRRFKRIPRTY